MNNSKRNKYAEKLAEKAAISYDEAYREMSVLKKATGISFADYFNKDMHSLDPHVRFREAEKIVRRKEKRQKYVDDITEQLGKNADEVWAELKRLNDKFGDVYHITMAVFHDYELYKNDDGTIKDKLSMLADRKELCDRFSDAYNTPFYEEHLGELEHLYNEITGINRSLLTDTRKDLYTEEFASRYPLMSEDEQLKAEISADFMTLHLAAGFSLVEYNMFDLFSRSFREKLAYSSEREMTELVREVNDPEIRYLLDDKFSCYRMLRSFYGREMVLIQKPEDARSAWLFFLKNRSFVKKPCFSRHGKGIRVVNSSDYKGRGKMVGELLKEDGEFVAEGLVIGHPAVNAFNPDSLNTVRILTVNTGREIPEFDENCEAVRKGMIRYAGKGIYCCGALFKTGRKGSFVDNGGAGGCFSAVDLNTGCSSAVACGEDGSDFEKHPDSGEAFASLRLDSIDKAIGLARSAALKISGAKIIGWDLALTEKGKWLLIEGNYSPTFLGQAPAGLGIHKEVQLLAGAMTGR